MFFNNKTEETRDMFNMARIGANIMKARKAKGLTQMALADELGISFQAVSNWERGQSCPDIAKLGELSQLLEVSIDELLGNRRAAEITKELSQDKTPDLKPEELEQVAPLLTEEQADKAADKSNRSFSDLTAVAPFVSEACLDKLARKQLANGCSLKELAAIAPFMSSELLSELAMTACREDDNLSDISALLPFVEDESLSQMALWAYEKGGAKTLSQIAPFVDESLLDKLALDAYEKNGLSSISTLAPFMGSQALNRIAADMLKAGKLTDIAPLLPFLDSSIIEEFLENRK